MCLSTGKRFVTKVENFGEFITLNDNSHWKVSIFDKSKSMMWMMGDEVMVTSYVGATCKITHTKRNETIEASHIEK
jgi:hypothetical protein